MRSAGKLIVLVATVVLLQVPVARADEEVSFSWGFFLKPSDGLIRSLYFSGQEPVVGGDLLRVYLQLHENSYVYVFLYDSRGDIYQVFPPSPDFYRHSFPAWQKYYIPSAREWFTLDEGHGVEKFFILASHERLLDLEDLAREVIFDRKGRPFVEQFVEIIKKKVVDFSSQQSVVIDPVQVSHTARPGPLGPKDGVTANRTVASGPYGLVLELVNR